MQLDAASIQAAIKAQVMRIAQSLGDDASELQADEVIPASGYIDSAGLLELIAWFEATYELRIPPEDFTIDNLGTLTSMADYLRHKKGLVPASRSGAERGQA